jgi:hypothetical protein
MRNRDRFGEAVMVTRDNGLPPALADAANSSLTLRIARAGGRARRRDDGHLSVTFASPLAAMRCALRVRWDTTAMFEGKHGFAMGIALDESEAADLAALTERGLVVSTGVRDAVEGEVDVDYEPHGENMWLTLPRHEGRGVFRFKPWTSPRRRRVGLFAAVVMIAVTVAGLLLGEPPPPR